ncbi:hypothetical protein ACO0LF_31060 [Undibacterium sp. Di27W]|uniref:hypothetical protein n=1 Tax=Undibacterium sp. Di27W TaxID=3413036 RepID=UPI003BF03B87
MQHSSALSARRYLRSEITEPAYAERQTISAIDKYALQLSNWLKPEAGKNRKQRRSLKQLHLDLKELGFEGWYDRMAAFARKWKVDQTDRVNSASKRAHRRIKVGNANNSTSKISPVCHTLTAHSFGRKTVSVILKTA